MFADVVLDGFDELGYRVKGSTANALARDLGKPAFDLIQPRGTGRGKVNVITRVCIEPLLYLRMLVRAVVVQDEMNIELRICSTIDLLQET